MAKYAPVSSTVEAFKIKDIKVDDSGCALLIQPAEESASSVTLMIADCVPKVDDYMVIENDGTKRIVPSHQFLKNFSVLTAMAMQALPLLAVMVC